MDYLLLGYWFIKLCTGSINAELPQMTPVHLHHSKLLWDGPVPFRYCKAQCRPAPVRPGPKALAFQPGGWHRNDRPRQTALRRKFGFAVRTMTKQGWCVNREGKTGWLSYFRPRHFVYNWAILFGQKRCANNRPRCWILGTGYWLLVIGYLLLVTGDWMLVVQFPCNRFV
jgi:hypothetical protein